MALDANKFGVLARVNAERVAPGHSSGENQEEEAPKNGHTADGFSGDLSGLFSTGGAWGSISTVVVASYCDNGGSSLGRRSIHGRRGHHNRLRGHHNRLRGHHHGLCVHFNTIIIRR